MNDLERRWPARLAAQQELRDRLLAAYAHPDRRYHDTRHLAEVLERVDALLGAELAAGVDPDAVLLAAWFHDAVYDADEDTEERSAALAEHELAAAGVPQPLVEEVARLVRLTAGHDPAQDDEAGKVLCDADLAILAADEARYAEYVRGVRQEYAAVPDDDFRAGRARVLARLLGSPSLFRTAHGKSYWEQPARRNVERELAALHGRGSG